MRLFVSEYLSSGGWREPILPDSLAREGQAMLLAVLADFARIPQWRIVTTWDARLGAFQLDGIQVLFVADANEEQRLFEHLAGECDATFVIAPEFDGILAERRRIVDRAGGRFLGSSLPAIELCGDKLRLAEHLKQNGIPTIETTAFDSEDRHCQIHFPIVIKPRHGAGSQQTFLVSDRNGLESIRDRITDANNRLSFVQQAYVPGLTCSVGAIAANHRQQIDVFPPGEQRLSDDGRFRYLGGRIPIQDHSFAAIEQLVHRTRRCIAGLGGYVGFDIVLPAEAVDHPLLVEVNPRLTTSYIGYRSLTGENLAERILNLERDFRPIDWKRRAVSFSSDGTVRIEQRCVSDLEDPRSARDSHNGRFCYQDSAPSSREINL